MFKILKHLKPYVGWLLVALALIVGQVFAELTLPDYMSDIVNNGLYYDYDPITPYEVQRSDDGSPQYVEMGGTVTNYPLPKNGVMTPISKESNPEDYNLFVDRETGRLLIGFRMEPMLGEDGTPVLGPDGQPVMTIMMRPRTDNDGNPVLDKDGNPILSPVMSYKTKNGEYNGEKIQKSDIPYILKKGGIMLLLTLAASGAAILICGLSSKISMGFGRIVRSKFFRKVEDFSLKEIDKFGTASLITRNTNDVTQLQNFVVMGVRILAMAPFMFGIALYKMIIQTAETASILYLSIPLILATIFIIGLLVSPLFKKMQKKVDRLTMVTRENLTGVRVIRAFNKQEQQNKKFEEANKDVTKITLKANRMMSVMMPAIQFIMNLSMVGIIFLSAKAVETGSGDVGAMMASMTYIMNIMMSLILVTMVFVQIPRASASAQRINDVLYEAPDIASPVSPVTECPETGTVEFRNVNFSYSDSEEMVLSDISFKANAGETTAIIGATGSGKSTILNLIPRFYDSTGGEVLVDGVNVKDLKVEDLRNRIGFVPQKALLFTGTIRDNMKYGDENATDDEIRKACDIAQASDFIDNTENGFESDVAQGGNNFSGGQKQRLSIARALVKQPEIYVFDDSFSALDFKTEAKLQAALKKEVGHAAVIVVAQRISSIMNADNILVVDEGKIVQQGKHRELLKTCEVYREIAQSQLSEEELQHE